MNKKLVLVTGMSGAGKSTAMSVMEDMGYRCIDQLPIQLLSDFLQLIQTTCSLFFLNHNLNLLLISLVLKDI